jgi:hypothetical protein
MADLCQHLIVEQNAGELDNYGELIHQGELTKIPVSSGPRIQS